MHVAINKFTAIVNNFTRDKVSTKGIVWIEIVLNCIVIHSWTQNAPFLNTTLTNNFQTEKDKGSRRPIFEIKRILLKERLIFHLWCVDLS